MKTMTNDTIDSKHEIKRGVLFKVQNQLFGFDVSSVDQVLPMMAYDVTSSDIDSNIIGTLNLKGEFIPLIDLLFMFRSTRAKFPLKTRILIVLEGEHRFGFIVDEALEIMNLSVQSENNQQSGWNTFVDQIAENEQGELIKLLSPKKIISKSQRTSSSNGGFEHA